MTTATIAGQGAATSSGPSWGRRLAEATPFIILVPSIVATLIYVFVFTGWTIYVSLSKSAMFPVATLQGTKAYSDLWANARWNIAYHNLFFYSLLYVLGAMAVGLTLAILIDQRVRAESTWRTIFLYPLAVSFVVTGTVWGWLYAPDTGIQMLVRSLGWSNFTFSLTTSKDTAIYAIVITGIWQSSGFAMALFLAGLRAVDPDIIRAAQIDGAGAFRTYTRVILPTIAPIFIAVLVVLLQFAIKTFDLVVALTAGGPGLATTFPALYVYDMMFQRGQIAQGAAAAMMILAALAVVLVPYAIWLVWRRRRESRSV
jgi:glucose/mannose transport system permease protein